MRYIYYRRTKHTSTPPQVVQCETLKSFVLSTVTDVIAVFIQKVIVVIIIMYSCQVHLIVLQFRPPVGEFCFFGFSVLKWPLSPFHVD